MFSNNLPDIKNKITKIVKDLLSEYINIKDTDKINETENLRQYIYRKLTKPKLTHLQNKNYKEWTYQDFTLNLLREGGSLHWFFCNNLKPNTNNS